MTDVNEFDHQANNLRAYSQFAKCKECGASGYTKTDQRWNIIGVVSCICCGACWMAFLIFKKKDLACYDTQHCCGNGSCNKVIAEYKGCL